jgi:hypothetical protein
LIDQSDNDLWLDCPIGDLALNVALNLRWRSSGRANLTRIWDGDRTGATHQLVWKRDEIARSNARLCGYEEASCCRLEDGDLDDIAHADTDHGRWGIPGSERSEEGAWPNFIDAI